MLGNLKGCWSEQKLTIRDGGVLVILFCFSVKTAEFVGALDLDGSKCCFETDHFGFWFQFQPRPPRLHILHQPGSLRFAPQSMGIERIQNLDTAERWKLHEAAVPIKRSVTKTSTSARGHWWAAAMVTINT